jgi:hypothetical protein
MEPLGPSRRADSSRSLRLQTNSAETLEADIHIRLKLRCSLHCRKAASSPDPSLLIFAVNGKFKAEGGRKQCPFKKIKI